MKFKVLKGTDLYKQLMELKARIKKANDAAQKLGKELGAKKTYRYGHELSGGIDAFEFDEKPEHWKSVSEPWRKLFMPKSLPKNKAIFEKLKALPIVKHEDLNHLVGFKPFTSFKASRFIMSSCPGVQFCKEYVLLDFPEDHKFKPKPDMIEITVSEYNKLKK